MINKIICVTIKEKIEEKSPFIDFFGDENHLNQTTSVLYIQNLYGASTLCVQTFLIHSYQ